MTLDQLLSNPGRLIALVCIVGFVLAINLPLFFPLGLSKMFEREATSWGKALRGGSDVAKQNDDRLDELHRQVEEFKSKPAEKKEDE